MTRIPSFSKSDLLTQEAAQKKLCHSQSTELLASCIVPGGKSYTAMIVFLSEQGPGLCYASSKTCSVGERI